MTASKIFDERERRFARRGFLSAQIILPETVGLTFNFYQPPFFRDILRLWIHTTGFTDLIEYPTCKYCILTEVSEPDLGAIPDMLPSISRRKHTKRGEAGTSRHQD